MTYYAQPYSEFSLFTTHLAWTLLLFEDKQWVKTQFISVSETANRVQSKYFCIKFISCVQNVFHRPRRMRSDVCKVVNSFVARCLRQVVPDLLRYTLAPEWSWTLGEVCETPEELHPKHDSQVGWALVNLVKLRPKQKGPNQTSLPRPWKSSETKSSTFPLQPSCRPPEDLVSSAREISWATKIKIYISRTLLATTDTLDSLKRLAQDWQLQGKGIYIAPYWQQCTPGDQALITVLPANYTCLSLPRKHSPDGATNDCGSRHLIAVYSSFINPQRMKGWVGLVGWLIADSLLSIYIYIYTRVVR